MNNIYEKNINAFKNIYGEYKKIEDNKYKDKIEDCKNGCKTLKIDVNGNKIYINSKYDPILEAKRLVEKQEVQRGYLIFCFGFGLSYYIRAILDKLDITEKLVVYEPDRDLFDICMQNIDISDLITDRRILLILESEISILNREIITVEFFERRKYVMNILFNYEKIYSEKILEFLRDIKDIYIKAMIDINTRVVFRDTWTTSNFENLEYLLDSYNIVDLKNIFHNKPVIIVSAGPSLNKNIKLLKEVKDKVCIICAFAVSKVLKSEGIVPNFLCTIDSFQHGLTEFEEKIPLIFIRESNTEILKGHKAEKIACIKGDDIIFNDLLNNEVELCNFIMGGTVASLAVNAAVTFGASEIILIGQDLSYKDENKCHAKGTDHLDFSKYRKSIVLKDIYGEDVYSDETLIGFKRWFDEYTRTLPEGCKIIQATEGGLPIENSEVITFREAIDKYCLNNVCDVKEVLKEAFEKNVKFKSIISSDEDPLKRVEDIIENIKSMKESIEEAEEISRKLLRNIKYSNNIDKSKNNNLIKRLDKIDAEIKENFIFKTLIKDFIDEIFNYIQISDEENKELAYAEMNEKFYYNVSKVVKRILDLLENYFKSKKSEEK